MNRKKTKCTLFWTASKRQGLPKKLLKKHSGNVANTLFSTKKNIKHNWKLLTRWPFMWPTVESLADFCYESTTLISCWVVEKKYSPNGCFKEWWFLKPHAVESPLQKKTTHQHHQTHPAPKKVGVDPTTWLFWPRLVVGKNHHHW